MLLITLLASEHSLIFSREKISDNRDGFLAEEVS